MEKSANDWIADGVIWLLKAAVEIFVHYCLGDQNAIKTILRTLAVKGSAKLGNATCGRPCEPIFGAAGGVVADVGIDAYDGKADGVVAKIKKAVKEPTRESIWNVTAVPAKDALVESRIIGEAGEAVGSFVKNHI